VVLGVKSSWFTWFVGFRPEEVLKLRGPRAMTYPFAVAVAAADASGMLVV
jgi:hypothetical protein